MVTLAVGKEAADVNLPDQVADSAPQTVPVSQQDSGYRAVEIAAIVVAIGVVIALLRVAEPFFVPLLIGVLTSSACGPLVNLLQRCSIPRSVGAAVVLSAVLALGVGAVYSLSDDAARFADQLPSTAKKVRQILREQFNGRTGALASMQKAATELERAASEASGAKPPPVTAPPERRASAIQAYLLASTSSMLARIAELLVALLIAYFLLTAGDAFRRKLARIAGPSLARRRVTIEAVNEINDQIQRYILILLATNVLIGVATWMLFAAAGIQAAGLWGVIAGILHVIPYAGTALLAGAAVVVGLIQFSSLSSALLLGAGCLVVATVIGTGLNTWLNSRYTRMNPVIVFAGLLFFGWLWGAWGLLLGVPVLAVVKAISERVEGMHPLAELMRAD